MNIEDTIAFILESQSRVQQRADRADARMDRAQERADRAEERADRADARMDRFDKQLQATRKLVEAGMKMVLRLAADTRAGKVEMKELRAELKEMARQSQRENKELRDLQKVTERKLQAFIDSLHKGTNGRGRA